MQLGNGNKDFKEGNFKANKKNLDNVIKLHSESLRAGLSHNQSGFKAMVRLRIKYPNLAIKDVVEAIKKSPALGFSNSSDGYIKLLEENIDITK